MRSNKPFWMMKGGNPAGAVASAPAVPAGGGTLLALGTLVGVLDDRGGRGFRAGRGRVAGEELVAD